MTLKIWLKTHGGEDNPNQVSAAEKTAGTETAERSFSPNDVVDMVEEHGVSGIPMARWYGVGQTEAAPLDTDIASGTTYDLSSEINVTGGDCPN